jgi:eukaryotic-like serine/threonine-protein kinase
VPRPRSLVSGYPRALERVVLRALSRKPADRFRSARELSRALEALLAARSLFVGSDEVALYLRSLFGDRVRERALDYEELSTLARIPYANRATSGA